MAMTGKPQGRGALDRGRWAEWLRTARSSDLVQKVTGTLAARMGLIVIGMASTVLISRILGPAGRGLFAAATAFAAVFIQFGNLGLHTSNTFYVAKDRRILPTLVGNSLATSFLLVGSLALGAWAVFRVKPEWAPVGGGLLTLAMISIPFGLSSQLLQNLLIGIQEIRIYNVIELGSKVVVVAALLGLVALGRVDATTVYTVSVAGFVLTLFWVLAELRKRYSGRISVSLPLFRLHLGYGLKVYFSSLFSFLVLRVDLLMVQYMRGAEQTGYYSVAVNMTDLIYQVPVITAAMIFPKLAALPDDLSRIRYSAKVTRVILFLMLGMCLVASLAAGPIIRLLFGAAFAPSVGGFLWLMPGIFFLGIQTVSGQLLGTIGFPIEVVWTWAAACLLNVLLNFWWIPTYGFVGAAAASSVSYFGVFLAIQWLIGRAVRRLTPGSASEGRPAS